MIPKTIHYLWLSDEKSANVKVCLESWRRHLEPAGYTITEWNRRTFPYNDWEWTRSAYEYKKWAFVTDFFRLWVLYNYGGIYLDADVTMRGTFDAFLDAPFFIGSECQDQLGPHVIGAEKGHPFLKTCLDYYDGRRYEGIISPNTVLPNIMTKLFIKEYGYDGQIVFFDGKPLKIKDIVIYDDTHFTINVYNGLNVCYHNGFGSWKSNGDYAKEEDFVFNAIEQYFRTKYLCYDLFKNKTLIQSLQNFFPWSLLLKRWKRKVQIKIKNNKRVRRVKL